MVSSGRTHRVFLYQTSPSSYSPFFGALGHEGLIPLRLGARLY